MKGIPEIAVFAGGCFWCLDAVFRELKGVTGVQAGYTGGEIESPTYDAVCSGSTGHAEAVLVEYDPEVLSYDILLNVFFATHDPTTLNRQGNDIGTQYRSAIFYRNDEQKKSAEETINRLEKDGTYSKIVTEVVPLTTFYPAEQYHQNYFARNPEQGYCSAIISPKLAKLRASFKELLLQS